jgi:hypothetical protein
LIDLSSRQTEIVRPICDCAVAKDTRDCAILEEEDTGHLLDVFFK